MEVSGPLLEVEMLKKCAPLWREARLEVKSVKNCHGRGTVGSCDVEKVQEDVARITFDGDPMSKSARCCGAKHIWLSPIIF